MDEQRIWYPKVPEVSNGQPIDYTDVDGLWVQEDYLYQLARPSGGGDGDGHDRSGPGSSGWLGPYRPGFSSHKESRLRPSGA